MSMPKMITDLRKKLTGATAELQSEIARLRGAIEDKRAALGHAQRAPVPLQEIVTERIPQVVSEAGAFWLKENGASLIYGERSLGSPDPTASRRLPWFWNESLPWAALCAARPDLATEILGNLARQVEYQPGPASSERPALIARLERELAALDATEEALIDEVNAGGITIAHRPEIVQRRAAEQAARDREERAMRDRQAREEAINRQHAEQRARGRSVPSTYLQRERER